jgi:hypothetical protein
MLLLFVCLARFPSVLPHYGPVPSPFNFNPSCALVSSPLFYIDKQIELNCVNYMMPVISPNGLIYLPDPRQHIEPIKGKLFWRYVNHSVLQSIKIPNSTSNQHTYIIPEDNILNNIPVYYRCICCSMGIRSAESNTNAFHRKWAEQHVLSYPLNPCFTCDNKHDKQSFASRHEFQNHIMRCRKRDWKNECIQLNKRQRLSDDALEKLNNDHTNLQNRFQQVTVEQKKAQENERALITEKVALLEAIMSLSNEHKNMNTNLNKNRPCELQAIASGGEWGGELGFHYLVTNCKPLRESLLGGWASIYIAQAVSISTNVYEKDVIFKVMLDAKTEINKKKMEFRLFQTERDTL